MSKSLCFLLFILFYIPYTVCSQQDEYTYQNNLTPPSPTAYELGKYGSHPVSYYRGTTSIDIPIYTLEAGSFQLPVSLSYNSSGIKVEDIASWVGLGWSLNAGGVISVMTKGKSDFVYKRFHIRNSDDLLEKHIPIDDTLSMIRNGSIDSEPDIYNYNFCGYSGQFVLDKDINVVFTKNSNGLSITADTTNMTFVVKDLKGRKFFFNSEHVEYSTKKKQIYGYYFYNNTYAPWGGWETDPYDIDPIPTAFYLSKIELENNQGEIHFEYESEIAQSISRMSGSVGQRVDIVQTGDNCSHNVSGEWEEQSASAFVKHWNINNTLRLSAINYTNEANSIKLLFNAFTERDDLKNTKMLNDIDLVINNATIYTWKLTHSYFTSDIAKTDETTNNNLDKRLKLEALQKFDGSLNLYDEPYSFVYYGDEESSDPTLNMPYRTSFDGYDHWGYCNSNSVSATNADLPSKLFPDISYNSFPVQDEVICIDTFQNSGNTTNRTAFIGGGGQYIFQYFDNERGNRETDEVFVKTHALEKIVYPTGGHTRFEYEPHVYGNGYDKLAGGLRLAKQISFDGHKETLEKRYSYHDARFGIEPSYIKPRIAPFIYSDCSTSPGIALCSIEQLWHEGFVLNTNSYLMEHSTNTDYIGYTGVHEILIANGVEKGKTVYKYRWSDYGELNFDYTFAYIDTDIYPQTKRAGIIYGYHKPVYPFSSGFTAPGHTRGLLDKTQQFNSGGKLVKETAYHYNFSSEQIVFGNEVHCEYPSQGRMWYISAYKLYGGKAFQDSVVTIQYDLEGESPVTTTVATLYDTIFELPLKVTEYANDILTTNYIYPFQFNITQNCGVYNSMINKRFIDFPIEVTKRRNGKVISSTSLEYAIVNGAPTVIKPSLIYKLENIGAIDNFQTISYNTNLCGFDRDNRYVESTFFTEYDIYGRLTEFNNANDVTHAVIWPSIIKKYPIASVTNASANQVAYTSFEDKLVANGTTSQTIGNWFLIGGPSWQHSSISKTGKYSLFINHSSPIETKNSMAAGDYIISLFAKDPSGISFSPSASQVESTNTSDNNWYLVVAKVSLGTAQKITVNVRGNIDELRLYPAGAQMTSYTFDCLSHVTSEVDINSKATTYNYQFGKLIEIKDMSGNILKTFDYNFAH